MPRNTYHNKPEIRTALTFITRKKSNESRDETTYTRVLSYKGRAIPFQHVKNYAKIHHAQVIHIKKALGLDSHKDKALIYPIFSSRFTRYFIAPTNGSGFYVVGQHKQQTVLLDFLHSNHRILQLLNKQESRSKQLFSALEDISKLINQRTRTTPHTRLFQQWKKDKKTIQKATIDGAISRATMSAFADMLN
jgi:hypothetical protein